MLRTIDKVGGLDEYLLGGKRARVKELGMGGWALRWSLWQTDMVRERFRTERERLGVPEGGWEGLIRKMKREGKGRELGLGVGGGDTKVVEGDEDVRIQEDEGAVDDDEEPINKEKAFMEEISLAESLEQTPAR